jgi:hypothetical protein
VGWAGNRPGGIDATEPCGGRVRPRDQHGARGKRVRVLEGESGWGSPRVRSESMSLRSVMTPA